MGPSTLGPIESGPHTAGMEFDRNGLEILDEAECLRLLGAAVVGRVAVTVAALPSVFPVNFCLLDGSIVFRTGTGTKLDAATTNAVVAFEVDDFDPVDHTGWSVVAVGLARDITAEADAAGTDTSLIPRWSGGADSRVVAIYPQMLSGRRLRHGASAGW